MSILLRLVGGDGLRTIDRIVKLEAQTVIRPQPCTCDCGQAGREGQLWYYRELADQINELLPGLTAEELNEVAVELERVAISD